MSMDARSFPFSFNRLDGSPSVDDIKKIILHILQDCAEKVDEVIVKADEEFKHERVKEILAGYAKIDEEYAEKEARTGRESLVFESKMKNISRLRVLQVKYEHVEDVLQKAKLRLSNKDLPNHAQPYRSILKALIMQGLCKLVEPNVVVYCRKMDYGMVRSLLPECAAAYSIASKLTVQLSMGDKKYLADDSEGGVLLATEDICLDNTLTSRLNTVGFYLLPEMGGRLFGGARWAAGAQESGGSGGEEAADLRPRPSYLPPLAWLERPITLYTQHIPPSAYTPSETSQEDTV